jgi:hypothetical protein
MTWLEKTLECGTKARLLGVATLALGALSGWFFLPIEEMLSGAERVTYSTRGIALTSVLLLLVAGRHTTLFIITREDKKTTWLQKLTVAVAIVLCVATYIGLESLMEQLGYA